VIGLREVSVCVFRLECFVSNVFGIRLTDSICVRLLGQVRLG
jgi:hypothetical protein